MIRLDITCRNEDVEKELIKFFSLNRELSSVKILDVDSLFKTIRFLDNYEKYIDLEVYIEYENIFWMFLNEKLNILNKCSFIIYNSSVIFEEFSVLPSSLLFSGSESKIKLDLSGSDSNCAIYFNGISDIEMKLPDLVKDLLISFDNCSIKNIVSKKVSNFSLTEDDISIVEFKNCLIGAEGIIYIGCHVNFIDRNVLDGCLYALGIRGKIPVGNGILYLGYYNNIIVNDNNNKDLSIIGSLNDSMVHTVTVIDDRTDNNSIEFRVKSYSPIIFNFEKLSYYKSIRLDVINSDDVFDYIIVSEYIDSMSHSPIVYICGESMPLYSGVAYDFYYDTLKNHYSDYPEMAEEQIKKVLYYNNNLYTVDTEGKTSEFLFYHAIAYNIYLYQMKDVYDDVDTKWEMFRKIMNNTFSHHNDYLNNVKTNENDEKLKRLMNMIYISGEL